MKLRKPDGTLVDATVTTEHAASCFEQPVVVLDNDEALTVHECSEWSVAQATSRELDGLLKGSYGMPFPEDAGDDPEDDLSP